MPQCYTQVGMQTRSVMMVEMGLLHLQCAIENRWQCSYIDNTVALFWQWWWCICFCSCTLYNIPYFLEISPHLEIPPPSKSHHTLVPINVALKISLHGKGSSDQSTRNSGERAWFESKCEAGEWTSRRPRNLATGCSDLKLNLAAARFRGNMVRWNFVRRKFAPVSPPALIGENYLAQVDVYVPYLKKFHNSSTPLSQLWPTFHYYSQNGWQSAHSLNMLNW